MGTITISMDIEGISEVSQTEEGKYHMTSCIHGI